MTDLGLLGLDNFYRICNARDSPANNIHPPPVANNNDISAIQVYLLIEAYKSHIERLENIVFICCVVTAVLLLQR